jgi:hypothetical protein
METIQDTLMGEIEPIESMIWAAHSLMQTARSSYAAAARDVLSRALREHGELVRLVDNSSESYTADRLNGIGSAMRVLDESLARVEPILEADERYGDVNEPEKVDAVHAAQLAEFVRRVPLTLAQKRVDFFLRASRTN